MISLRERRIREDEIRGQAPAWLRPGRFETHKYILLVKSDLQTSLETLIIP